MLLLAFIVSPLCSSPCAEAKSAIENVVERGVLRVGFSTFVPWAMQDKNGGYIGFEIDVAKKLAEDLNHKMEFIRRFKAKATKARQAASRQKQAKRLEKEMENYRP